MEFRSGTVRSRVAEVRFLLCMPAWWFRCSLTGESGAVRSSPQRRSFESEGLRSPRR